jgi:AcrR family transcriptional regulator
MTGSRARGGRPRSAERDSALLEATQDLLVEVGYDRLSMDAVAARCRASKATIYRRWSSKQELVLDAVSALHHRQPTPDTGTLRGDLIAVASGFIGPDTRRDAVIAGLIPAMGQNDELREVVNEAIGRPRTDEFAAVVNRAVDAGLVPGGRDVELISRLFPALAFHQVAALGGGVDVAFIDNVVDHVLLPLLR